MNANPATIVTLAILVLLVIVAIGQVINPRFLYSQRWNPSGRVPSDTIGRVQGIILAVLVIAFAVGLASGKLHIG